MTFPLWLKELGSPCVSNGDSKAKSIFAIADAAEIKCEIVVADIILKDDLGSMWIVISSTQLFHFIILIKISHKYNHLNQDRIIITIRTTITTLQYSPTIKIELAKDALSMK